MAESWVRLWAGMTTDPKWKTIARKSGRPLTEVIAVFTHAMLMANDDDDRGSIAGWNTEDVASALDMDEENVEAIHQAMQGRVIEHGRLSGWDRRQPYRNDDGDERTGAMSAAERKRLQRAREASENATKVTDPSRDVTRCHEMSRDVTLGHAPEAEAEAEEVNLSLPDGRGGKPADEPPAMPPCPIDSIISLYHETLPECPKLMVRNKARDGYIRSRWRDFYVEGDFKTQEEGLGVFRWYFADRVKPSKFLTGRAATSRNDRDPFVADLEWLMRPQNFAKVIEGKYA